MRPAPSTSRATVTPSWTPHLGLPRITVKREVLDERELEPFRAAVEAGVACIMTAHIVVGAIDPGVPATFSEKVLRGVLRQELGFDGVIVSDALDMVGASGEIGVPEAAVRALAAGCDLLCLGSQTTGSALDEVVDAVLGRGRAGPARRGAAGRGARARGPPRCRLPATTPSPPGHCDLGAGPPGARRRAGVRDR